MGQVYNTAFGFIRQNRSVLFKSITYYIMPFILVAAFFVFNGIGSIVTAVQNGAESNWVAIVLAIGQGLAGLIIGYLAYATYITLVYEYMKLYHDAEDPRTVTHRDVWRATRKRFLVGFANVLVWGVLVSSLTTVVFVLFYICLFVGAMVSVLLNSPELIVVCYIILYIIEYALVLYIQVFSFPMLFISAIDRVDIFTAFGRSFSMVNRKKNFWNAVGITFLGGIILWILRYVSIFPITLLVGIIGFNSLEASDFQPGSFWYQMVFRVALPTATLFYFYSFVVYLVAEAFEALSLDERIHAKGLTKKIEGLGTYRDVGPEYYEVTY